MMCDVDDRCFRIKNVLGWHLNLYLKPEESLLPGSHTREPHQVEYFSIEVYIPSLVGYRETECYGRMGFRHPALFCELTKNNIH